MCSGTYYAIGVAKLSHKLSRTHLSASFQSNTTEFSEKGCQGDRTSCHKAFAPCLRVTEGDRRVTGFAGYEIAAALAALLVFLHFAAIMLSELKCHFTALKCHFMALKCHFTEIQWH